jgi:hypothetical protein
MAAQTETMTVSDPEQVRHDHVRHPDQAKHDGTAPGGLGEPHPPPPNIPELTVDVMRFYNDVQLNQMNPDIGLDLSRVVTDLSGGPISKPALAQVLTAALARDAGSNAGTLAHDLTNIYFGHIVADQGTQSPKLAEDVLNMMDETVAVGSTYHGLAATESASEALAQTVAQFKLS